MVQRADPIITQFTQVVRKNIISPRIILFGSRARGTASRTSDYDFAVISKSFTKLSPEKRSTKLYLLKQNIPAAMDILCYTPKEFERKKKKKSGA